ncbi:ATP-binding cassette domain-containing protein, partial [uncultured Actinomyces sp.]|uniref:ATP-binding cassette domain-containing protein n=1 Tax=uncultured Actinomyces sp. TaxID=249061 RepID=UPI00262F8023
MPAITLTDISFSFTAEPLLAGITLTVADGERACLVGPNGCGKTTLLRWAATGA